jgi:cytochrome b
MRRDAMGMTLPLWVGPALLAVLACVLLWGSRFVPAAPAASGNADALTVGGVVCAFFAVRAVWRMPGVGR